jgi:acylphosphatase
MAFLLVMSDQREQLHAIVRGAVQGVYFRAATRTEAQRLGLTGWVRNRADGAVEVTAEGPPAVLGQLLAYLQHGPPTARVSEVQPDWLPALGKFHRFEVR